jgi:hypothetical protein
VAGGVGLANAISVSAAQGVEVGTTDATGAGVITSILKEEQATRLNDISNTSRIFFAFIIPHAWIRYEYNVSFRSPVPNKTPNLTWRSGVFS